MLITQKYTWGLSVVLFGTIFTGSLCGIFMPKIVGILSEHCDHLILLLVGSIFFSLNFKHFPTLQKISKTAFLAVSINFLIIPFIAFGIIRVLPSTPIRIGVLIYCLAPCTDWFCGFTRLADGDTVIGATLIPVQMTLQLLLYPFWIWVFAGQEIDVDFFKIGYTLLVWCFVPATAGLFLRLLIEVCSPSTWRNRIIHTVDSSVPLIISAVVFTVFSINIETILSNLSSFPLVFFLVFVFFVITYFLNEKISHTFKLGYRQKAVLAMTTSARNSPLMLAITIISLPNQPILYATIIMGMLIEFPHLTALTYILRRRMPKVKTIDSSKNFVSLS